MANNSQIVTRVSESAGKERKLRMWPLISAACLSVANLFIHKPISDICDALYEQVGRRWYEIISVTVIGVSCLVAAGFVIGRLRLAFRTTWISLSLVGLAILTLASQRWLLVTNIELVHFPQFALVSILFLAAGIEPKAAWLLGTLAGLLDETYQHFVLYAGVPNTYFDINDILLNAIGAAWGVLLFGGDRLAESGPIAPRSRVSIGLLIAGLALIAIAVSLDPPDPVLLRPAATRRLYRVLSWGEGLLGLLAVVGLVELASRRRNAKGAAAGSAAEDLR